MTDKEYGYIVDYKDLFKSLEKSIKDYTGGAFEEYDAEDVAGLLKDRLEKGRERLEELRESVKALCEPVEPPKDTAAYVRFFCAADSGNADQLKDNEPKRVALYKLVAALVRAYANLANEMAAAGYSTDEAAAIKAEVSHYEKVREEVKLASGDYVDMKLYEPAMRHLLDTYIRAEESKVLSTFDDMTLIQLIVEQGEQAVESLPGGIRGNQEAVAETIENNVRRLIIDESPVNPKYYEKMSELLDALIRQRKQEALDYKAYLARIVELTKKVRHPETQAGSYPFAINTPAQRAFYDNLKGRVDVSHLTVPNTGDGLVAESANAPEVIAAIEIDKAVRAVKKDDWRGMRAKRIEVRNAIRSVLGNADDLVDDIYKIIESRNDY